MTSHFIKTKAIIRQQTCFNSLKLKIKADNARFNNSLFLILEIYAQAYLIFISINFKSPI